MIWSNNERPLLSKAMDFGEINFISLGESGRGRKEIILPSSIEVSKGLNPTLFIGLTKTNRPRINHNEMNSKKEIHLLLDSSGGYTRRGNGTISYYGAVEVIAVGNGADGDAGRIGQWTAAVLKITGEAWIWIKYSGGRGERELIYISEDLNIQSLKGNIEQILTGVDHLDIDISPIMSIAGVPDISICINPSTQCWGCFKKDCPHWGGLKETLVEIV
jgi:hypothetical protein